MAKGPTQVACTGTQAASGLLTRLEQKFDLYKWKALF